ncbi:hypothetical protein JNUCC31_19450 [Paenibacillus sp. JNUCC31]|uniref:hypothetical protein n=1 Tax=Paenibacillus sp. JNUCC-31 TaxID=2777983 RepID=UPI00178338FF|nr:hypothetical protein [Paenibacillus sp. JNUCC-31]QOS76989.1 hypothetical protein JNUCC31_19450 [Paenibacillus sp. JNUCC-31]
MSKQDEPSRNKHEPNKNPAQSSEESGENATRPIHLTQGEINALQKALLYLKFECEENDSLLYAGSPLLNSVLEKVLKVSAFREFAKDFHSRPNAYAETFMRNKLERSYAEEFAPRERTEEQKAEILRCCMFPYPVK